MFLFFAGEEEMIEKLLIYKFGINTSIKHSFPILGEIQIKEKFGFSLPIKKQKAIQYGE